MRKLIIKKGDRFGRLTIVKEIARNNGRRRFLCRCICGNLREVNLSNMRTGQVKSCGCLKDDVLMKRNVTHGLSKHPLFIKWCAIKKRCSNKNDSHYKYYGGRGIKICDEWRNDFKAFYDFAMSHGWKKGLQIDRIDNDGNYEPDNCAFVKNKINCQHTSHCKLTPNKVCRIRYFLSVQQSRKWCAKFFNVCVGTIDRIAQGKSWANIQGVGV